MSLHIHLDDCWAKTDPESGRPVLSVREHCFIVGLVAEELLKILPGATKRVLPPGAVALAAAHDIGKLTFGFECKCEHWKVWARDRGVNVNRLQNSCRNHAEVSMADVEARLGAARRWAAAIGGHHGRFLRSPRREHSGSRKIFGPLRDELARQISDRFGAFPAQPPPGGSEQAEYPFIAALCGFIILSDWLGSDEENFPLPAAAEFPPESAPDFEKLADLARRALRRRSLVQPGLRTELDFAMLFTPAGDAPYSPNPLQEECLARITGPGLYIVEAPMGMGKTEAALHTAARLIAEGKASGLYFALPTQLTSNKIHERVASFLSRALDEEAPDATLALAHAASWLKNPADFRIHPSAGGGRDEDETDPRAARTWFTSRRALLARYGVGTIDQALMGALPVKFAALRLFGLAGKVVVLDEVHTYDAYTGALIDRLIADLVALRCTVVILSATLTRARRASLVAAACPGAEPPASGAYPLLTCCPADAAPEPVEIAYPDDSPRHRVAIRRVRMPEPDLPEELAGEILARAGQGECVLVIRNTVALAQQTFSQVQQEGVESGLIHSRFPFHVRNGHPDPEFQDPEFPNGREDFWAARLGKAGPRPKGCVLVATQVAEQSLDIDADLLVTDLCPADMLLQRIGRLWRHMGLRPASARPCPEPETWVLVPDIPSDADADAMEQALRPHSMVYAPHTLLRTLAELPEKVEIPGGIRPLLEAVHAPPPESGEPPAMAELRARMETKIRQLEDRAGFLNDRYLPPQNDDESATPTRYSDYPSIDLVLLRARPKPLPGGAIELSFHSGESLQWTPGQLWNFRIARAVFLSTARVPRYQIPREDPPEWLALHTRGHAVAAVVIDGALQAAESGAPLPFRYEPLRGLVFDKELAGESAVSSNSFDTDYDECFF